MPDLSLLLAMRRYNPNGQGFVAETRTWKGVAFDRFVDELDMVGDDENCIIHFRFATCGSVKDQNCHPFSQNGVSFAHNGCLPIRACNDMTDSETAFRRMLMPAIEKYGYGSKEMDRAVDKVIGGSRFAFMKDGEIRTYGPFVRLDGLLFSNLNFMRWQRYD